MTSVKFAIFVAGDAYSTAGKIMGRQSAGKAMIEGLARGWPNETLHLFGADKTAGKALAAQLSNQGHRGAVRWRSSPGDETLDRLGAVYYPAPVTTGLAHARNSRGPSRYSLFGVTHTLSSENAMDQIAALVMPPFKPWDALICTSTAALDVVTRLQDEMREWQSRETGATRFNAVQTPVIPLGVNAPAFARTSAGIGQGRRALGIADDEIAFLFAGRLSFHAKANPAVVYQALERAAASSGRKLVCIEAGVYPNIHLQKSFEEARRALAPSVRFIGVDGRDDAAYAHAWSAPDVFLSLSDNIQETFGLTPVEAMAAGLPVVVSDWNGYKDTVRDGVDGFRIPVTLPMAGSGVDLASRHALAMDTYDYYIGRTSLATAVDLDILADRLSVLAREPELRRRLGQAGAERARSLYDWPIILGRYNELMDTLADVRSAAGASEPQPWPLRPDPFALFETYPTHTLSDASKIAPRLDVAAVKAMLGLQVAGYALDDAVLGAETILKVYAPLERRAELSVGDLLKAAGVPRPQGVRALMWLAKFSLVDVRP